MSEKKRITKRDYFLDILALLNGEVPPNNSSLAEVESFIHKELEQLARKNSGDTKRDKEKKEADEGYTEEIISYLAALPLDSKGMTCTEIFKAIPSLAAEFSPQKVASLLRPLKAAGRVVCIENKGKMLYSLA